MPDFFKNNWHKPVLLSSIYTTDCLICTACVSWYSVGLDPPNHRHVPTMTHRSNPGQKLHPKPPLCKNPLQCMHADVQHYKNLDFGDRSMKFGTHVEDPLRKIFGYRSIAHFARNKNWQPFSKWLPSITDTSGSKQPRILILHGGWS